MRHLFLINPKAGKQDRTDALRQQISSTLTPLGLSWEIQVTDHPHHATELARTAAESGELLRIYACGGDGTLNEVAAGAAGFDNVSVTNWATGSGNDFIKLFGEDASRFFDLEQLLDCEVSPMDLIDCNGRLAVNVCSVGFDARVGLGMVDFKKWPLVSGVMAYQLSLVTNVIKGINRPYHVELTAPDGTVETFDQKFALICLCNGRYYGGSYNPSPDALPDDGILHIVMAKKVSRIAFAKMVGGYAKGRACDYPDYLLLRQATSVKIVCDKVSMVNLDGERIDTDSLSVGLSAKKINFAHPVGSSWVPKSKKSEESERTFA